MILCDLCNQPKPCEARQIENKVYDICSDCWMPLAGKLKGKGREIKERETVFLPTPHIAKEPEEPVPQPGEPPKIWGRLSRPQ